MALRVQKQATRLFRQNSWAKHWFKEFMRVDDMPIAMGAFELFSRGADKRARHWVGTEFSRNKPTVTEWKRRHLAVAWKRIERRIGDELEKKLREQLFFTRIDRQVAPWH